MKELVSHMRSFLLSLIVLSTLCSCGIKEEESITRATLQGMVGTWGFEGTELSETWTQLETDHYQGVVHRSFNGVLEPMQRIDIMLHRDSATYTGTRIGAHESSLPISYQLKESEKGTMIFENILDRFPQEIRYDVISTREFTVTMSGQQDGKSREKVFRYNRLGPV